MKKGTTTKKSKQLVSDEQRQNLRKWHIRLALLLIAEAVAIVILGGSQTVPVTLQYLANDQLASEASGHQVLAVATRHLFDVQLSWVVAKFLLIMGAGYLLLATLWRTKYEAWLERGVNKGRWLIFGLSGGGMAVAIAMLSGISDISSLIVICGLVLISALAAMAVELIGPVRRLKYLLGAVAVFAGLLTWAVFKLSLFGVLMYGGELPNFVYYVYASMFLIFAGLILASYFRAKQRGRWADISYAERSYLMLGFLGATVLAWQIFAGALQ